MQSNLYQFQYFMFTNVSTLWNHTLYSRRRFSPVPLDNLPIKSTNNMKSIYQSYVNGYTTTAYKK